MFKYSGEISINFKESFKKSENFGYWSASNVILNELKELIEKIWFDFRTLSQTERMNVGEIRGLDWLFNINPDEFCGKYKPLDGSV